MSLYEWLTREARPRRWEGKLVWLFRRELKRAVLRAIKQKFPEEWAAFDRAEHERLLRDWRPEMVSGMVTAASKDDAVDRFLRTETGRRIFAQKLAAHHIPSA